MKRALALIIALGAAQATAGPMTGEEFRAIAEGWTLHFRDQSGEYFGSEQYFEDGRTVWLPAGGDCRKGVWAEDQGRICFLYDVGISCWLLFPEGEDGVYAESAEGEPPETRLWLIRRDHSPVLCPEGPGV